MWRKVLEVVAAHGGSRGGGNDGILAYFFSFVSDLDRHRQIRKEVYSSKSSGDLTTSSYEDRVKALYRSWLLQTYVLSIRTTFDIVCSLLALALGVLPPQEELEQTQRADREDRPAAWEKRKQRSSQPRGPSRGPKHGAATDAVRTPKLRPSRSRAPHMMCLAPVVEWKKGCESEGDTRQSRMSGGCPWPELRGIQNRPAVPSHSHTCRNAP